jgi:short-chain fatty acids transporter
MTAAPRERFHERFALWVSRWVPDAITASVLMTAVVMLAALLVGNSLTRTLEAYHRGLWMLLPFTMQMTLIIMLSSALGETPVMRRGIAGLARLPRTRNQMVALAILTSAAASYLYWGLGYALAPVIAIFFSAEAERRGLEMDFPFLFAAVYAAQAVWQYGLSASGPLLIAQPGHFLEKTIGVIPLSATIWSPAALLHIGLYVAASITAGCWLMPRHCRRISEFPEALSVTKAHQENGDEQPSLTFSQYLEGSRLVNLAMCALLSSWLLYHFVLMGLGHDINSLNVTLLFLTFLAYRNVRRFAKAMETAAGRSWAVIVLYHLYAGIAGLIQFTDVGEKLAQVAAALSTPSTLPVITAICGAVFAFFIPSSGGQMTVQGFITVKTAQVVGVSIPRAVLSLGLGDHMGNLLTPFWYVVVAGIGRVDFRLFFGYGVVFAAIWFLIGLVVFTFAPC